MNNSDKEQGQIISYLNIENAWTFLKIIGLSVTKILFRHKHVRYSYLRKSQQKIFTRIEWCQQCKYSTMKNRHNRSNEKK